MILSGRAETLGLLSVWIVGSAAVVLIGGAWTYFVRRDIA